MGRERVREREKAERGWEGDRERWIREREGERKRGREG